MSEVLTVLKVRMVLRVRNFTPSLDPRTILNFADLANPQDLADLADSSQW
jgi:hypothetical protein